MSKHFAIVTAASLVVGGMGLTALAQDMNDQTRTEVRVTADPTADRSQIKRALSDTVAAALSADADISARVSESDRARLSNIDQGRDNVRQAAQRVREAFRAKYNQDFDLSQNQPMVFNDQFVQLRGEGEARVYREGDDRGPQIPGGMAGQSIDTGAINQPRGASARGEAGEDHLRNKEMEGGIAGQGPRQERDATARTGADTADGARVAGEVQVGDASARAEARTDGSGANEAVRTRPEIPGGIAGQSVGTGDVTSAEGATRKEGEAQLAGERIPAEGANTTAGDRMHVTIPASHGMPATQVPLVREGTEWRIDLPSGMDGQRLNQSLAKHLNQAADGANNWPADATEGYRAISHQVLMALTDR